MNSDFYNAFKKDSVVINATETCEERQFEYKGKPYIVAKTMKFADRHTVIKCEKEQIIWEQIIPLGIRPVSEEKVIIKTSFAKGNARGIFVISGEPLRIEGLDDGCCISPLRATESDRDIYVLTASSFKRFDPEQTP